MRLILILNLTCPHVITYAKTEKKDANWSINFNLHFEEQLLATGRAQ